MARRRHNLIRVLHIDFGNWVMNSNDLKSLAVAFYTNLFTTEVSDGYAYHVRGHFEPLSSTEVNNLVRPISDDEVRKAMFDMGPLKAPVWFGGIVGLRFAICLSGNCFVFNLADSSFATFNGDEWFYLFGVVLWFIWKHRNMLIFEQDAVSGEPVIVVACCLVQACRDARSLRGEQIGGRSEVGFFPWFNTLIECLIGIGIGR
ncbi:hypothetical protein V6N13_138118 [Hibiscus sabdariffa]